MTEKTLQNGVNRRDFLRIAGLATGATVTLPLQAYARFLFDGRPPLTIGMIVPRSTVFPELGRMLVDGMKLQLAESGWDSTRLLVREVASGDEIAAARKLLAEARVEILTGMFNPLAVNRLRDDLDRSGALFINIEGGANSFVPREESPLMYQNSLGYWQSNWAMGNWAVGNMGKRAAMVTSFYESGYDSCYAFPQGFEVAGGKIICSAVTHAPLGGTDPETAMKGAVASRPDFIFVSAGGQDALELVAAYHGAGLAGKIPLVASGFLLHGELLTRLGSSAQGITSCLPWSSTLDTPENRDFCSAFSRATGAQPDSFAVLGYDTGSLIVRAVAAAGTVKRSSDLKKALEHLEIASPRGTFGIIPSSGSSDAPLYLCEVKKIGQTFSHAVVSRLSSQQAVEKQARRSDLIAKSGWTNSYLCA